MSQQDGCGLYADLDPISNQCFPNAAGQALMEQVDSWTAQPAAAATRAPLPGGAAGHAAQPAALVTPTPTGTTTGGNLTDDQLFALAAAADPGLTRQEWNDTLTQMNTGQAAGGTQQTTQTTTPPPATTFEEIDDTEKAKDKDSRLAGFTDAEAKAIVANFGTIINEVTKPDGKIYLKWLDADGKPHETYRRYDRTQDQDAIAKDAAAAAKAKVEPEAVETWEDEGEPQTADDGSVWQLQRNSVTKRTQLTQIQPAPPVAAKPPPTNPFGFVTPGASIPGGTSATTGPGTGVQGSNYYVGGFPTAPIGAMTRVDQETGEIIEQAYIDGRLQERHTGETVPGWIPLSQRPKESGIGTDVRTNQKTGVIEKWNGFDWIDTGKKDPKWIDQARIWDEGMAEREFAYRQSIDAARLKADADKEAARLAADKEARLASLAANPASWLEYSIAAGKKPVVQPWQKPLMAQQYGNLNVGDVIPNWDEAVKANDLTKLPAQLRPSDQYMARLGPSSKAGYYSYQQGQTGARPEDTDFWLRSFSAPGGNNPALRYSR